MPLPNLHKRNSQIIRLLNNSNLSTNIYLYFSTKTVGEDYDPYEKNYTYTNLNPLVIKGYVRDIKSESLTWRQFGLSEIGSKEIICEDKHEDWFKKCNKIKIDGDYYQTYKEGVGGKFLIEKRPYKLIKVIVRKIT